MPYIKYGNSNIHYFIYKHHRKDVRIVVDLVNGVMIYAPEEISDKKIQDILSSKARWIYEKIQELDEVKVNVAPKEFVSGEKLPYLGRQYRLKIHREAVEQASFGFKQGRFIATVPSNWVQEKIQSTLEVNLEEWYRKRGLKKIQERVTYFEHLLGVGAKSIQLKTQHKRWGTCTPEGNIYLNWRIVMAPVRVIDYIIVHELSHLRIPEHNQNFWSLVKSILPHYEEDKEWLRVYGMELYCIAHKKHNYLSS